MSSRNWCRKNLHDLRDPANTHWRTRADGVTIRHCVPCKRVAEREYKKAQRRAQGILPRGTGHRPAAAQLAALQQIADGLTVVEAADAEGVTEDVMENRLRRVRRRYGVASTAAAVYVGLLRREITPVRPSRHPMPPRSNIVRNHARSLAALLRGERTPCRNPRGPASQQMLDDLYAFTEAHAVSVLWAARLLARDGIPRWIEPEKDMTRADHATAA